MDVYYPRIAVYLACIIICAQLGIIHSKSFSRLNNMIRHYEPVQYDRDVFHTGHTRMRRSLTDTNTLQLNAFGRQMELVLRRDYDSLAHDVIITTAQGPVKFDSDRLYKGHVEGEVDSYVHGLITTDHTFQGRIRIGDETFNVEKASKYFPDGEVDFHTVIYRNNDIDHHKIKGQVKCPSESLHEQQKEMFSKDKVVRKPKVEVFTQTEEGLHHHEADYLQYKPANSTTGRKKRAIDYTKQQCTLYIEADVTYYEKYDSNPITVIEQLVAHVQGANAIYELVDFDGDVVGNGDGINFIIKKIKIWTSTNDDGYKFSGSWSVAAFLTEFSTDVDWDDYCLAYIFNNRDFDGGILGLAWTGDADADGGVCEESASYSNVHMSLNSGLVTILNYGNSMPLSISIITFSHELGHNMGSPHDDDGDSTCSPGGSDGNYIMYPHATDGDKENNNKFSPCSISSMHAIMRTDARSEDTGCFQATATSQCGNRVVEDGETCDCGYEDQCDDACCDASTCQLTPGASCSPASDYCCQVNCSFIPAIPVTECRAASNCKASANCDGGNGTCPVSDNAANGTYCYDGQLVCVSGECIGSLCLRADMLQCQCKWEDSGDWDDERLCQLCCSPDTSGDNCSSSYDLAILNGTEVLSGTPCNDYRGYCDSLLTCRKYDPESSFRALRNLFTDEGIKSLSKWLAQKWYIPVSATVGFIVLMVLLIKFGVPKKKSDKKKKKKEEKKDDKNKVGPSSKKKGGPPAKREAFSPPNKY